MYANNGHIIKLVRNILRRSGSNLLGAFNLATPMYLTTNYTTITQSLIIQCFKYGCMHKSYLYTNSITCSCRCIGYCIRTV